LVSYNLDKDNLPFLIVTLLGGRHTFSFALISGISLGVLLWPINIKSYGPLILDGGLQDENGFQSFQTPLKAFSCHMLYIIRFIYKFSFVENELFII
jgi:hypothetical protein